MFTKKFNHKSQLDNYIKRNKQQAKYLVLSGNTTTTTPVEYFFDGEKINPISNQNYIIVDTINNRNEIFEDVRIEGMVCYINETKEEYRLIGGITNDNWKISKNNLKRIDVDTIPFSNTSGLNFSLNLSMIEKWFPYIGNYYGLFLFEIHQSGVGIVGKDLIFNNTTELENWIRLNLSDGELSLIKCYYYENQDIGSVSALKANNFGYSLLKGGKYKSSSNKTLGDSYYDVKWTNLNNFIKSIYNDFLGIDASLNSIEFAKAIWFPKNIKKLYQHHRDDITPPSYIEIQESISQYRNVFDISGNLSGVNTLTTGTKMNIIDSKFYAFNKSIMPSTYNILSNNTKPIEFILNDSIIKVYLLKDDISQKYAFYIKPVGVDNFYINGSSINPPSSVIAVSKGSTQTKYYNIDNINYINNTANDILVTFNKNESLLNALGGFNYKKYLSNPNNINSNNVSFILNYGNGIFSKPTNEIKFLAYKKGVCLQIHV